MKSRHLPKFTRQQIENLIPEEWKERMSIKLDDKTIYFKSEQIDKHIISNYRVSIDSIIEISIDHDVIFFYLDRFGHSFLATWYTTGNVSVTI